MLSISQDEAILVGGNTPLILCASEGDIENAKLQLANGADINERNEQGATALLIAVLNNKPMMVSFLLGMRADASIASKRGTTPKALAKKKGSKEIIQLLSDSHKKTNAVSISMAEKRNIFVLIVLLLLFLPLWAYSMWKGTLLVASSFPSYFFKIPLGLMSLENIFIFIISLAATASVLYIVFYFLPWGFLILLNKLTVPVNTKESKNLVESEVSLEEVKAILKEAKVSRETEIKGEVFPSWHRNYTGGNNMTTAKAPEEIKFIDDENEVMGNRTGNT